MCIHSFSLLLKEYDLSAVPHIYGYVNSYFHSFPQWNITDLGRTISPLLQFHIAYFKSKKYDVNIIIQKFHKLIFTAKFHTKRTDNTKCSREEQTNCIRQKSVSFWNITFFTLGNSEVSVIAKRYYNIYISA